MCIRDQPTGSVEDAHRRFLEAEDEMMARIDGETLRLFLHFEDAARDYHNARILDTMSGLMVGGEIFTDDK